MTQCTQRTLEFQGLGRRQVTARFDAPAISSDAGGLLLREVDAKFKFLEQLRKPGSPVLMKGYKRQIGCHPI